MNTDRLILIAGSFFTSFGGILVTQVPSPTGYWIGVAMGCLGPLLLGQSISKK